MHWSCCINIWLCLHLQQKQLQLVLAFSPILRWSPTGCHIPKHELQLHLAKCYPLLFTAEVPQIMTIKTIDLKCKKSTVAQQWRVQWWVHLASHIRTIYIHSQKRLNQLDFSHLSSACRLSVCCPSPTAPEALGSSRWTPCSAGRWWGRRWGRPPEASSPTRRAATTTSCLLSCSDAGKKCVKTGKKERGKNTAIQKRAGQAGRSWEREEEGKMERSLRNAEEEVKRWGGTVGFNRKTRNAWHFGNSKVERCGADRAFSTAGPWDRRRREHWLFINSSHSQTPNQILSLNLPGQNVWTRTHTAERNIIGTQSSKDASRGDFYCEWGAFSTLGL